MSAAQGTIIYVAYSSVLRALEPETGRAFFELAQPSGTRAAPAMSGSFLHVSLFDRMQSAPFDLVPYSADASSPGGWSSPAIGDDGTVYVVTTDGRLLAYPPP
jgi:hypothetical protein